ncbi:chromate efflux transporter [Oligoflexus tunisiensis]|uniref:chromate efflux transporter n=1 Tax=Oligoflexus tunisiensis TaxID=708132 RepID=UPI000B2F95D7|nr:chromate efflux transporter [Oligoflexus tunisiensis]
MTSTNKHSVSHRKEIFWLFLKLGTIAFGGPAAHVAMMEDEIVRRRKWVSREEFLDLLGATNLIPGPNSTELAIHLGHRRGGWPGLLIAGAAFILPAALIVTACAWAYVKFGAKPEVLHLLYGIKPVIIGVVAQALWGLSKSAVKTRVLAAVGIIAAGLNYLGINELAVLFGAGLCMLLLRWVKGRSQVADGGSAMAGGGVLLSWLSQGTAVSTASFGVPASLGGLFLFFLKVGSVLFGSGYVLLAFLRADLVERLGWLTESQLLDAIAIGQVTPGPVFTTATFIGYLIAGNLGALVATIGIFLPAFIFVALSGPLIPRLRKSQLAGAFLDGVNVASLALMAVVTLQLTTSALVDITTLILAASSAVLLIRYKVNSAWLVLGGGLIGLLVGMN